MTEDTISEKFSEKKRGRPTCIHPAVRDALNIFYCDNTQRTKANKEYYFRAYEVLSECSPDLHEFFRIGHYETVMSEIGRFPTAELMLEAAQWFAEEKPKAKEAVPMLRRWRLAITGKEKNRTGDIKQLYRELAQTINEFTSRYPDTSWDSVHLVLTALCEEAARNKA